MIDTIDQLNETSKAEGGVTFIYDIRRKFFCGISIETRCKNIYQIGYDEQQRKVVIHSFKTK